jgi:hypothetical protein
MEDLDPRIDDLSIVQRCENVPPDLMSEVADVVELALSGRPRQLQLQGAAKPPTQQSSGNDTR